ncbi:M20/M25/M40 family metallo-hydrolase [Siminovitchia sediminis]|uniref:M20/M25/M40 family metallo-hydrolase n=1 Tax=Siminovitchia sediminis TaxID=1274353 RepID=A0ABW4KDK4_9BACI
MAIKELAQGLGDEVTITIGKLNIHPGEILCIPGEVSFIVNVSLKNDSKREELINNIKEISRNIVLEEKMQIDINKILNFPPISFTSQIQSEIESVAHDLGYSTLNVLSGGGHDANYMLNIAPTGIIFIPCKEGISHSVKEYASETDIEKGANVLLNTVINLANKSSF